MKKYCWHGNDKYPLRTLYMRRRVDARTPSNPQVAKMNRWGRKQRFDSMGDYCCVCGFHPRETLEEVVLKDVTNPLPII